jgi:hypothetical protein
MKILSDSLQIAKTVSVAVIIPQPLRDIGGIVAHSWKNKFIEKDYCILLIEQTAKLLISTCIIFSMKNTSPSTAWDNITKQPIQAAALGLFYSKVLSFSVPDLTIGGWICFQGLVTLVNGIAKKEKIQIAHGLAGYVAGRVIMDGYIGSQTRGIIDRAVHQQTTNLVDFLYKIMPKSESD